MLPAFGFSSKYLMMRFALYTFLFTIASRSSKPLKSLLTPIWSSTTCGVTLLSPSGNDKSTLSSSLVSLLRSEPIESAINCVDFGSMVAPLAFRQFSMNGGSSRSFIFMLSNSTPASRIALTQAVFLPSILPFLWHITRIVDAMGCLKYFSSGSVFLMF